MLGFLWEKLPIRYLGSAACRKSGSSFKKKAASQKNYKALTAPRPGIYWYDTGTIRIPLIFFGFRVDNFHKLELSSVISEAGSGPGDANSPM